MDVGHRRACSGALWVGAAVLCAIGCDRLNYDVDVTSERGLPAPLTSFTSRDIGATSVPGVTSAQGDQVTLRGAGKPLCGPDDGYRFLYRSISTSDVQLTMRAQTLQSTSGDAAIGLMLRDGLDPGARVAAVFKNAFVRVKFAVRAASGGPTACSDQNMELPVWLRLTKSADQVTFEYSANGMDWTRLGRESVHLDKIFAGVVVTSAVPDLLTSATFDSVAVTMGPL